MISFVDFRVVDFRVVMTAGRLDSLNFSGESNGYIDLSAYLTTYKNMQC